MDVEKLVLFQKAYDFLLWLYFLVQHLPKRHKPVLGKYLEESAISLLLLIIHANKASDRRRHRIQKEISDELDLLRILIRLTKDLRFMSVKQYAFSAEKLNEMGKILYGWSNFQRNTARKNSPQKKPLANKVENLRLF